MPVIINAESIIRRKYGKDKLKLLKQQVQTALIEMEKGEEGDYKIPVDETVPPELIIDLIVNLCRKRYGKHIYAPRNKKVRNKKGGGCLHVC